MRALATLDPDVGDIERTLVDLHRACQAFIADVYSRAVQMDPREELDWSDAHDMAQRTNAGDPMRAGVRAVLITVLGEQS